MKLAGKMRKTLAMATMVTMLSTMSVTTMAKDYDTHWAKNVIAEWEQYGIIEGTGNGSFKPNNNVTKAELAAFITRVFGLVDDKTSVKYSDVPTDIWYADEVAKVTAAGIMTGKNGMFNPNAPATREEAAAALAVAYNLTNGTTTSFVDDAQISDWAKAGVSALASKGYITGKPGGKFDPKANLTRAEFITMIDRMTESFANKAGTYTGDKNGNVLVNTKDVVLENMTINGDLYLTQGIGTGDVTLKKVTVKGQTFIAGGGINSIKMFECVMPNGATITSTHPVRVVSEGGKLSIKAKEGTQIILTGSFDKVEIPAGVKVELRGVTVEKITIVPSKKNPDAKTEITTDDKTTIKALQADAAVTVTGKGKITALIANVAGVKTEAIPSSIVVKEGVEKPVTGPTSGGGGGGGGGPVVVKYTVSGKVSIGDVSQKGVEITVMEKIADGSYVGKYSAITAADGSYSFTDISKGDYRIEVKHIKGDIAYAYNSNLAIAENKTIAIALEEVTAIKATVGDYYSDHTLSNAKVSIDIKVNDQNEQEVITFTDESGVAYLFLDQKLSAGKDYKVAYTVAPSEQDNYYKAAEGTFTINSQDSIVPVDLKMKAAYTVQVYDDANSDGCHVTSGRDIWVDVPFLLEADQIEGVMLHVADIEDGQQVTVVGPLDKQKTMILGKRYTVDKFLEYTTGISQTTLEDVITQVIVDSGIPIELVEGYTDRLVAKIESIIGTADIDDLWPQDGSVSTVTLQKALDKVCDYLDNKATEDEIKDLKAVMSALGIELYEESGKITSASVQIKIIGKDASGKEVTLAPYANVQIR